MTIFQWIMGRLTPPAPNPPTGPKPEPPGDDRTHVLAQVNAVRAKHKLPPLAESPHLTIYADAWASAMNAAHTLDHGDTDDRLSMYPIHGECIEYGPQSPAAVVDAWEHHPPHLAVMVGSAFTIAGVGHSGNYWCLDVARER